MKEDKAVSELIGTLLLMIMAVIIAVTVYWYLLPVPIEPFETNALIMGYTEHEDIYLEHMGGETITDYTIIVGRGNLTYSYVRNDTWMIGGHKLIPDDDLHLSAGSITVYVLDVNGFTLFNGVFTL